MCPQSECSSILSETDHETEKETKDKVEGRREGKRQGWEEEGREGRKRRKEMRKEGRAGGREIERPRMDEMGIEGKELKDSGNREEQKEGKREIKE